MTANREPGAHDALRDAAVEWLVRVQSDTATADDWTALTEWLAQSEDHLSAYEAVEAVSAEISYSAAVLASSIQPPTAQVLAFAPRKAPPRRGIIAALSAIAASLVLAPLAWQASLGSPTTYRTAPGETREIVLKDGTHIRMDAASTLTTRLGWRTRRVILSDAEATFDVAKDPGRPFVISVGDQEVRVVGTQFNIRHYDGLFVLTVNRGVVEVRQPSLSSDSLARLTVGDELTHRDGTSTSARAKVDPQAAFAWTQGRLICNDRPLPEIVAYLNRRYPSPIRLKGAAATARFSGVLELGDSDTLVRRLGTYLSLPVHRADGEFTLG